MVNASRARRRGAVLVQVLTMSTVTIVQTSFAQPGGTGDTEGAQPAKKLPSTQQAPPVQRPLNPSQELAKEQPEGNALRAGPIEMRIGGYVGLTAIHRSTQYRDTFFLALGQAFSLMTAAEDQLSIWPGDVEMSTAVDTNYLAGMIWTRMPQVRFTWRPSRRFNWAISAENPEQQIGRSLVTLPACCRSGSVQLGLQTSWLSRTPWDRDHGPRSADAILFYAQLRYNLP